jgi:hypothetical protein
MFSTWKEFSTAFFAKTQFTLSEYKNVFSLACYIIFKALKWNIAEEGGGNALDLGLRKGGEK